MLATLVMNYLRNIFTLCMALLVSMPMCVCGNTELLNPEMEEISCHSHCHGDSHENNEDNSHCDSSEHNSLLFLLPEYEKKSLDAQDNDSSHFYIPDQYLLLWEWSSLQTLTRPPPDTESFSSTRRLHEIYSSYRL